MLSTKNNSVFLYEPHENRFLEVPCGCINFHDEECKSIKDNNTYYSDTSKSDNFNLVENKDFNAENICFRE